MLARCTAKLLTGKGGDEALEDACLGLYLGRTRKHAEASMRGALETLDGLMRRSDDGSAEGAVWAQALRSKRRSGLMVRWLLCRESVEPLRAALRPSDDDKWRKLAALEAAAEACRSSAEGTAPAALAALAATGAGAALVEACGTDPTRASIAAARCVHEIAYALASASPWAGETTDGGDSDDDDDALESRARAVIGRRSLAALWGFKAPLAVALKRAVRWYGGGASHRAAYVVAIEDLLTEMGGDAVSLATGDYDAKGAAAAAARKTSAVARATVGVAELRARAVAADRDGKEKESNKLRDAADRAIAAAAARLAWLVRTMPPVELFRDWGDNKDAEVLRALERSTAELASVAASDERKDDSDDEDGGQEYFRRMVNKRAVVADVRRVTTRRLCLLLGQLKRKRLEDAFERRPELQKALHEATSSLLRLKPEEPPPAASSEQRRDSAQCFKEVCEATASLAAVATRRVLDGPLDEGHLEAMAAPLLAILDDDDGGKRGRDAVSAAVGEFLAPLALKDTNHAVLRDVLGRATRHESVAALDVVQSIVDRAALAPEEGRRTRTIVAEDLVAWLAGGNATLGTDDLGRLFGKLDSEVVVPLVCRHLQAIAPEDDDDDKAKQTKTPESRVRLHLETALGACVSEARDVADAVLQLWRTLRDLDEHDGVKVAPWMDRVLGRLPQWLSKVAGAGGDRWTRVAESSAVRAATVTRDGMVVRVWGAVADLLVNDVAAAHNALRAVVVVVEQGSEEPADDEARLFAHIAPLLVFKRTPANVWMVRYVHVHHSPLADVR